MDSEFEFNFEFRFDYDYDFDIDFGFDVDVDFDIEFYFDFDFVTGMIGHLFGPITCRWHDAYLLRRSELHDELSAVLHVFPIDYLCYGDAAYPVQRYIKRGVKRARTPDLANQVDAQNAMEMSRVRECVEWDFGKIVNMWAFLDLKKT